MKVQIERTKSFLVAHSKAAYYVGFMLVGLTFSGKEQLREGLRDSTAEHAKAIERFETSNSKTKAIADSPRHDFQSQAIYGKETGQTKLPPDTCNR